MTSLPVITGLGVGLVGSLHCIGMCGPIAVALPLGKGNTWSKLWGGVIYNLGRSATYGVLGLIFGLLGKGIQLAGFQQWVSIFLGVAMVASVFFPYLFRDHFSQNLSERGFTGKIVALLRKVFQNHSRSNLLIIGLLNGLLPCGLVYVAVAAALNTNEILSGFLLMIAFGLGTIPVMLTVSMLGHTFSHQLKQRFNQIVPVFIVILGILFILRGMSLGIPYISPRESKLHPATESSSGGCCSKKANPEADTLHIQFPPVQE